MGELYLTTQGVFRLAGDFYSRSILSLSIGRRLEPLVSSCS